MGYLIDSIILILLSHLPHFNTCTKCNYNYTRIYTVEKEPKTDFHFPLVV